MTMEEWRLERTEKGKGGEGREKGTNREGREKTVKEERRTDGYIVLVFRPSILNPELGARSTFFLILFRAFPK